MNTRTASYLVAAGLIVPVVTQILYMVMLGGPQPADPAEGVTNADVARYFTDRWPEIASIWTTELIAFGALAFGALILLTRGSTPVIAWSALLLSALFNLIQIGIGLSMFPAAGTAGEAMASVFSTIVAGAFFFYFLAKLLVGIAAIGLGIALWRRGGTAAKAIAALGILTGGAAAIANFATLPQGTALIEQAGATGTLAALVSGLAALMLSRDTASD